MIAVSPGYPGTPLLKKLGIKPGYKVRTVHAPANYRELLGALPDGVILSEGGARPADLVHCFVTSRSELDRQFPIVKKLIEKDGIVWMSWPKKSSGVSTDVAEDDIRAVGLRNDLVDVKVCAVDNVWSALKFVYRRADR